MRLLHRLWHHIAQRHVEIFSMMLAAAVLEHREDGAYCLLEHFLLGFHVAAEWRKLGDRGAFAHAEFDPAVAQQIQHRDAFGDTRGMIGGELKNSMAETNGLCALAG